MELEDLHEWVSFEDAHEERTWVFDVTFLTSNWTCIFGAGCPGVLTGPTPEREQGCCSYGAHFIDEDDEASTLAMASRLRPDQWQFHKEAKRRGGPTRTNSSGEIVTRLVGDACIFLNRPDFPGGAGCALHRAAMECGERPLDWKPDVCWQLPLRLIEDTDDHGHVTSTLREWKRRDWGDGGAEFHWWCTDDDAAFVGAIPVIDALAPEIIEMVGPLPYEQVREFIARRGEGQYLPHPALRKQKED